METSDYYNEECMSLGEFKALVKGGSFGIYTRIKEVTVSPRNRLKIALSDGTIDRPIVIYVLYAVREGVTRLNKKSVQFFIDANKQPDISELFEPNEFLVKDS